MYRIHYKVHILNYFIAKTLCRFLLSERNLGNLICSWLFQLLNLCEYPLPGPLSHKTAFWSTPQSCSYSFIPLWILIKASYLLGNDKWTWLLCASTNHIQGIYLYLKFTPRKPNNIQSFTVAPGLQFIFKALGFQID